MAADVLFLEYPKCSTCQKAKKWLDTHGVTYADRHIVEDNPTADELRAWHERSGCPSSASSTRAACSTARWSCQKKFARDVRRRAIRPARHQRHAREAPSLVTADTVIPVSRKPLGKRRWGLKEVEPQQDRPAPSNLESHSRFERSFIRGTSRCDMMRAIVKGWICDINQRAKHFTRIPR